MSQIKQTPEQIEADITRQRGELASTVAQLEYRLDVKARGKEKLAELRHRPTVVGGFAVGVLAVVGLAVWRARRNRPTRRRLTGHRRPRR